MANRNNAEKVAYLAEWMGYKVEMHPEPYQDSNPLVTYPDGHVTQHWNPLKDWNHWRMVEEELIKREDASLLADYFLCLNKRKDDVIEISGIRAGKIFNMIQHFFEADLEKRVNAFIHVLEARNHG